MPKKLHHRTNPIDHRRLAYPRTGDSVDAIMKGFRALITQGIELPDETVAWVEECEAVKKRYRKDPPNGQ